MTVDVEKLAAFIQAAHRDLEQVKKLLAADPDLLAARYEKYNETAIEAAAHMGRREIVEFLMGQGAQADICVWAMLGRREEVAALLDRDPGLARARGAHGRFSALFHAAVGGDVEIARMLVEHGAGADAGGALHPAVKHGHLAVAELLLDNGADDLEVLDINDQTPLQVALARGDEALAALLRSRGAREPA